ncbi:TadE family type IV pilus minor pilin [Arthrobacter sp. RHLT1-20]
MTAEFAVALPAVLLLLALLLAGSAAGVTQLRLEEAARAGARALARGEDTSAVDAIVRRLAGDSAASAVASEGEWLSVTVSGRVFGAVGSLLPWTLSARAWARGEPSEPFAAAPVHDTFHDTFHDTAHDQPRRRAA